MLPNMYEIEDVLLSWAANVSRIDNFTVSNVLNAIGLANIYYKDVLQYLMSKKGTVLIPRKMLLCSSNDKGSVFPLEEELDGEDSFTCKICGEEYYPTADNLMIVFEFEDGFREYAKKKISIVA